MKVYISGPITGTSDYMERFRHASMQLRSDGHVPFNPAAVNSMLPEETTYEEYMRMSLALLDMCDAIQMLSGWEKSIGANREYGYALGTNKKILFQTVKDGDKEEESEETTPPLKNL